MDIKDWNKAEIGRLAKQSGKPLETQVAKSFQDAGWETFISTTYVDSTTQKLRELDVVAERANGIQYSGISVKKAFLKPKKPQSVDVLMQVSISCKGFKETDTAITYSIAPESLPDRVVPQLIHRVPPEFLAYSSDLSARLLSELFPTKKRIVGFDIFRCVEGAPAIGQKPAIPDKYSREQDKDILFEGLDSALKAAVYWRNLPAIDEAIRSLFLPILVTSRPWWDVPIDHGIVGEPSVSSRGLLKLLYPYAGNANPLPAFALIWSATDLPNLLPSLNRLYDSWLQRFVDEGNRHS